MPCGRPNRISVDLLLSSGQLVSIRKRGPVRHPLLSVSRMHEYEVAIVRRTAITFLLRHETPYRRREAFEPMVWVVAGGVEFCLAFSWLVLVMSGRLEASDGASIHRCHKHVLSTSRNASSANEFEPFSGCSHLLILILHSLSGVLCRLLRAWRELKRNLPQCSLKRKKRASSEMSPVIAAHVFSWAWRYNLDITSADAFARDLAGIL